MEFANGQKPEIDAVDLTMDDDDNLQPIVPHEISVEDPKIKQEPDTEPHGHVAIEPLPDLPPSTIDEMFVEDTEVLDETFENNLADALREYHANSHEENEATPDPEYDEALAAFEAKQTDIATKESLGDIDPADHIELKALENSLHQATKRRNRLQQHEELRDEQNSMFIPEGAVSDGEDIHMMRPPTRDEMTGATRTGEQTESSEEERSPRVNAKGAKKKPAAKAKAGRKTPATRGKTRVTKSSQAGRRGGRQDNARMLNIGSLMRNDIVADAHRNQGLPDQPSLGGARNKKDALNALIASIPKEQQDVTRGLKSKIDKACKEFSWNGRGSMRPDGVQGWKLKGMTSSLKTFQLLSTAWGLQRERGQDAPFGGILADTMGYGKTVQMIAIMVEHKPQRKHQTTLIVVPASLVAQWVDEICKHTEKGIMDKVFVYKASTCAQMGIRDIPGYLSMFQVVITTYHEVMRNLPNCEPPVHLVTEKAKNDWWDQYYEKNKGPLLDMRFFRIVLDEAQTIKNHESRTSKACRQMTAKYKWVLTGTPLSNCMEELYPYFNFLSVDGSDTYGQFKHNYAKRNDTTTQRLDAILRKVMIRRTQADRLFGRPLTKLPALDHTTVSIPFNKVEKAIYTVVRQRFIDNIHTWTATGKISQLTRNIFVMLTRLRQMCAHVLMITNTLRDLLQTEDVVKLWKVVERHSQDPNDDTGTKTAQILKRILREAQDDKREESMTPSSSAGSNEENAIDLTVNDASVDFRALFYRLQNEGVWDKVRNRSTCSLCHDVPDEDRAKLSVPCSHLYCGDCLNTILESAQQANTEAECVACHNVVTGIADVNALAQIAAEATSQRGRYRVSPTATTTKKKGRKGKEDPDLKWLSIPGCENLSSKIRAVTDQMRKWIDTDPNAKIVVFTLFIPMVKLLSKVCVKENWGFEQYTGQLSTDQRNKALARWKDPEQDNQVLVMSMRAGGLGLNLTEASYVIIIDPWWNEAAEDQAFSRVYRIGQQRDCVVRRYVIQDAIDTQLMLHLQKLKTQECDRVIDGRSQAELSVRDLIKLFGPVARDPQTNEVIAEPDENVDETEEFIPGDGYQVIDDSDGEDMMPAPARPRDD